MKNLLSGVAVLASTAIVAIAGSMVPVEAVGHPQTSSTAVVMTSELTICFGEACTISHPTAASASPAILPAPNGDDFTDVYCGRSYTFSDSNGTFSYQHACGGSTSPWGYTISPAVQRIVSGPVSETGMSWRRNGVVQTLQKPHVVPANYIFHGTFNPVRKGDNLSYSDTFNFNCNLGSGCKATIAIHGALRQVS